MQIRPLATLRRVWNSESSPIALRSKQFVGWVLPDRVLLEVKKRYYVTQLRSDSDESLEEDAKALPWLVEPGDFVIDVGAFAGSYTQRLSRLVGPSGVVWSFEPMPRTFQILAYAVRRLALTNVKLLPYAVSDVERATAMEIPRFRGGGESWWDARIVRDGRRRSSHRQFDITTKTLDSMLAGNDRPLTFIKIDAEYHELHCIRGALETLRRWHPIVQVETLTDVDKEGTDLHTLVELLRELGYTAYIYDGTSFRMRAPGEKRQNLFFLCADHLRRRSLSQRLVA
jgi:FkbM family methyltransferase